MSKLEIGDQYEVTFSYTQDEVNAFMEVTGDRNPLHYDATYAAGTMFKKPIIHGFLSGAIFSKIFGMDFPGEGTIYLSQSMQFRRPMYVGETYTARVEVAAIDREKHRCTMSAKVLDARGKETIVGEAELMNAGRV